MLDRARRSGQPGDLGEERIHEGLDVAAGLRRVGAGVRQELFGRGPGGLRRGLTALPGEVVPAETAQIGWSTLDSDDPSLVPPGPWMQWHTDRFVVPPTATEIARDAACSQAFVLRRNLAVQFHPEVDEAGIAHWLQLAGADGEAAAQAAGTSSEQLLADARANAVQASRNVESLVDAFLTEVAGLA